MNQHHYRLQLPGHQTCATEQRGFDWGSVEAFVSVNLGLLHSDAVEAIVEVAHHLALHEQLRQYRRGFAHVCNGLRLADCKLRNVEGIVRNQFANLLAGRVEFGMESVLEQSRDLAIAHPLEAQDRTVLIGAGEVLRHAGV